MDVAEVETMPVFSSNIPDTNEWAEKIAEDLRASGRLPPKEEDAGK